MSRTPRLLPYILLPLLTIAVYSLVPTFGFVSYDDLTNVAANPAVQGGLTLDGIRWAFDPEESTVTGIWHPVTWLSWMLDAQLFGDRAGGYHLTNALLHLLNVVLLYSLLVFLTKARWRALFIAAVFAVHPLHVESVAWVTERKNVLSTAFGLLALWAYAAYVRRRAGKWYWAALLLFGLSLLSKPMLVTLPFVLLLLDYWPLRRDAGWPRLVREKSPFFVLSALFSIVAVLAQRSAEAVSSVEAVSLPARLFNAAVAYVLYIVKTVAPSNLAVFYPHPKETLSLTLAAASAVGVIALSLLAAAGHRRLPACTVGWFWYVGTLVPVIGIVQVGSQQMADRYMYVPQIGLLICLAWLVPEVLPDRRWLPVAATVVVLAFAWLARAQTLVWLDSRSLFAHAVAVTESNHVAHHNLGVYHLAHGDGAKGLEHLRAAIRSEGNFTPAHLALAHALLAEGDRDGAYSHMERALRGEPGSDWSQDGRGRVLTHRGPLDATGSADAHTRLGWLRYRLGQNDSAVRQLRRATRVDPGYAVAPYELGSLMAELGRPDLAESSFRRAIELDGEDSRFHNRLGVVLRAQQRHQEAVEPLLTAVRLSPDDPVLHLNLGATLAMAGRTQEAARSLQEALRLNPDYPEARQELARLTGGGGAEERPR